MTINVPSYGAGSGSVATSASVPDSIKESPSEGSSFWGEDGFSFSDLVDIVNPLQQIPGVSYVYRQLSGDSISGGSKLIGGGVFGGVIGFVAGFFETAFEQIHGKEVLQAVADWVDPDAPNASTAEASTRKATIKGLTPDEASATLAPVYYQDDPAFAPRAPSTLHRYGKLQAAEAHRLDLRL